MNLIDSFEPMEIPANGLTQVRRNARNRKIKHRALAGGAALALPVCVIAGLGQLHQNDFDSGTNYVSSPPTVSTNPTSTGTPITPGNVQISVRPDPNGLPGSSVSLQIIQGILFYTSVLVGIAALAVVVNSVVRSIRTKTRILRFKKAEWLVIAVGFILPTCLFILGWFFSAGN